MNTVQNQLQASVEEFGKTAYLRFRWKNKDSQCPTHTPWRDCYHNADAECLLYENDQYNGGTICELKPISDLIAHDIEHYGDKAYLMWEHLSPTTGEWYSQAKLPDLSTAMAYRRKTTAALPFDLDRAKEGDVVYHQYRVADGRVFTTELEPVEVLDDRTLYFVEAGYEDYFTAKPEEFWYQEGDSTETLFMKYPKKQRQGDSKC